MKQKILFFAAVLMALISCDGNKPVEQEIEQPSGSYVGTFVVDSAFSLEQAVVDFLPSDSIENAYMLYFHDATFAEIMPTMDIIVDGIKESETNVYEADGIIPFMVMGPARVPVERYIFSDIKITLWARGELTHLSMTSKCGQYLLKFEGNAIK